MAEPRWLLDGMLGRLARYLRFMGYDTEYARTADDDELVRRARSEPRTLVTRDRELAGRVEGAILLTTTALRTQLRQMERAVPGLLREVRFDRCSLCNERLTPAASSPLDPGGSSGTEVRRVPEVVVACPACGQRYWEGSHTARIRRTLLEAAAEPA